MFSNVSELPILLLDINYIKAVSSGSGSCQELDVVENLSSADCPSFCLSPDGQGSTWWEIDMAGLYLITHIYLKGNELVNMTYDVKLYTTINDSYPYADMEYKVCS